ncbi:hypothetical protein BC936DRAFT_142119, partial [Jimgerdemannia flammicorona]
EIFGLSLCSSYSFTFGRRPSSGTSKGEWGLNLALFWICKIGNSASVLRHSRTVFLQCFEWIIGSSLPASRPNGTSIVTNSQDPRQKTLRAPPSRVPQAPLLALYVLAASSYRRHSCCSSLCDTRERHVCCCI